MTRPKNTQPQPHAGNKGVAINSVRNLQRRLTKEGRALKESERLNQEWVNS